MNDQIFVSNKYKDTIFRMLFKEKQHLLELFNAVNGTAYDNPEELSVVTLENAIYMSIKNDVSCLLDMRLQLYEQQSTVNPNMPLRDLMYVCDQYEKYLINRDIYSRKLIKLPTPKFIVFYNGTEKQPERTELHLSDAFEIQDETPSLELHVIQLNINPGYNSTLLEKCPMLFQYMQYVSLVREYHKTHPLEQAVQLAVDSCIANGILRDFLLANKAEVIKMSIYEYDEELHKKTLHDEGYEDGFHDGFHNGFDDGFHDGFDDGFTNGFDDGFTNGFDDGFSNGFNDGFSDGKLLYLISLVCRKLRKNKSPELITTELEENTDTILSICDAAKSFAPDYDEQQILEKLKATQQ